MIGRMTFLAFVFAATSCFAGSTQIEKVAFPNEVKQEVRRIDPEIEGKVWNRWTSDNFVVCALNNTQAQYLHNHLESVKSWIYARWGLPDIKFSAECRLICVDDRELYKKMFNLEKSLVERRNDEGGRIKMTVIFLLIEDSPSKTVPVPLTEACLGEFEQQYQVRFGLWAHRGMARLNGTLPDIRQGVAELHQVVNQDKGVYLSKGLFSITPEEYAKAEVGQQELYDKSAVCLCLLLRKEFGQDKFLQFLKAGQSDPQAALKSVYGFTSYEHFDKSLQRYMKDIASDAVGARPDRPKLPDSYLQIREKSIAH